MGRFEENYGIVPDRLYSWIRYRNEEEHARQGVWEEQREKYGFDETEIWSLDHTLAAFIFPRIAMLKDITKDGGWPTKFSKEEWENILDTIIDGCVSYLDTRRNTYAKGKEMFQHSLTLIRDNIEFLWA